MSLLCWMSFTSKKKISQCSSDGGNAHMRHTLHNIFTEVFKPFNWQLPLAISKAYHQKNCQTPHPSHSCATKPWFIRGRFVWLYWVLKGALHPHRLPWNLLFERKTESPLCRKHGREKCCTRRFWLILFHCWSFSLYIFGCHCILTFRPSIRML